MAIVETGKVCEDQVDTTHFPRENNMPNWKTHATLIFCVNAVIY
jgi:hypothetical protein